MCLSSVQGEVVQGELVWGLRVPGTERVWGWKRRKNERIGMDLEQSIR